MSFVARSTVKFPKGPAPKTKQGQTYQSRVNSQVQVKVDHGVCLLLVCTNGEQIQHLLRKIKEKEILFDSAAPVDTDAIVDA